MFYRVGHGRGEDPDPGVFSLEIPSVDCTLCITESLLASPRWSQPQTMQGSCFRVRVQFCDWCLGTQCYPQ